MNKKNIKPTKLIKKVSNLMLDKKAIDITLIDVSKITTLTDHFIICTSDSGPQTKAITNHIVSNIHKKYNIKPVHSEGIESFEWVLLDYINIVVNIFNKEKREYYNIERLWGDADIIDIKESFINNEK